MERLTYDHSLAQWRPQRLGIFFSQNFDQRTTVEERVGFEVPYTCLILIEPIRVVMRPQKTPSESPWRFSTKQPRSSKKKREEFLFCYRKVISEDAYKHLNTDPNARCENGWAWYTIEEEDMQGTIRYIIMELLLRFVKSSTRPSELRRQYLKFFSAVSSDVLWSWEEFANQVVQFSAVRSSGRFP